MKIRLIRAFLAGLLFLGALAVVAFLVVVDITDDISRHEDSWTRQGFRHTAEMASDAN